MPNVTSTEADVLRCGYRVGYFDKADIAQWADRQIAACDAPADELLDLSMIRRTHPLDVTKLLRALGTPDSAKSSQATIGFLGLLLAQRRITSHQAIRELYALVHEPGLTDEQQGFIYHLDDGYDLAITGTYGTLNEIEQELRDFVVPYADGLAKQFPHLIPAVAQEFRTSEE